MTEHLSDEQNRMQRRKRAHVLRRLAIVGAIVVVLAVLGGIGFGAWRFRQANEMKVPSTLVVIAESELEDGTKVAGAVAMLSWSASDVISVEPVDTLGSADIPGTSYDRLRDALSLGGAELVARLSSGATDAEDLGWLLLDEDAWSLLVDDAGGAPVTLSGSTTVFTGEKLFRFSKGSRTLTGEEAAALLRGSETLSGADKGAGVRSEITSAIATAVTRDPNATAILVKEGEAESSLQPEVLAEALGGAPVRQ